jgi:hypothetical protein
MSTPPSEQKNSADTDPLSDKALVQKSMLIFIPLIGLTLFIIASGLENKLLTRLTKAELIDKHIIVSM